MKLIDIVNGPWAITPEMLGEIQSIYRAHMRGPKIDIPEVEAKIGRPLNNTREDAYQLVDGVAILSLDGPLARRMNLFMAISGGTSSELLQRDFNQAMNDPQVKSIMFVINSPGGTVAGTQELAEAIYARRGEKPMITLAEDLMASAAYWIGSATDKIYISEETALVGSIGVVASHVDVSKAEESRGYKTTEITAGRYKRISSQFEPLTDEGRADIQEKVDALYTVFVDAVAKYRDVSVEEVLQNMADGRIFVGHQAITAGLVDGVATFDQLLEDMRNPRTTHQTAGAGAAQANHFEGEENMLTIEKLRAEHGDLVAQIEADAREGYIIQADVDQQVADSREQGAADERARIQAVEDQWIPGHEALINELKFDGKTTGAEAAQQVLAAEKSARVSVVDQIDGESGTPVPPAEGGQEFGIDSSAPIEERAKAEWDKDSDLRSEFGGKFESYLAFRKNEEAGRARVMKRS